MIKKTLFIILAIIILGIGVGISLLYTRVFDPFWNPFRLEPEKVILKMEEKMRGVKLYHQEFLGELEVKNKKRGILSFKTSGDYDLSQFKKEFDFEKINLAGSFEFSFDLSFPLEGIEIPLKGKIAGEQVQLGRVSYFKFTTLPSLPFLELPLKFFGIDFSQFKNQWIKYDPEAFKKVYLEAISETVPLSLEEKETMKETEKLQKKIEEKLRKRIGEKLRSLIKGKKLYFVKKEFPDEKIKNQKVYHYLVLLNKEELKKIISEFFPEILEEAFKGLMEIEKKTSSLEEQKKASLKKSKRKDLIEKETIFPLEESPEMIEMGLKTIVGLMVTKINEFLDKAGDLGAEIWIGKKDFYLYRILIKSEIEIKKLLELLYGPEFIKKELSQKELEKIKDLKLAFKIDIDFSQFNQPVKIEAPKEFKGFEEIFKGFIEKIKMMEKLKGEELPPTSKDLFLPQTPFSF
jgi:hypothetical protein